MDPLKRLEAARAELAQAEMAVRQAHCSEVGCDMQSIGGKSAGCCDTCQCSVAVLQCTKCGDCDYGDNEEAKRTVEECQARIELEEADAADERVQQERLEALMEDEENERSA